MNSVFKTFDLDLAAYLMSEGLPYLGMEVSKERDRGRTQVYICFIDKKQVALDLSRVFIGSREKRYREFLKFLLKEVHRQIDAGGGNK